MDKPTRYYIAARTHAAAERLAYALRLASNHWRYVYEAVQMYGLLGGILLVDQSLQWIDGDKRYNLLRTARERRMTIIEMEVLQA